MSRYLIKIKNESTADDYIKFIIAAPREVTATNVEGVKNSKCYEGILELLDNGISVITAVNIQHIESLNDVIARQTNISVLGKTINFSV